MKSLYISNFEKSKKYDVKKVHVITLALLLVTSLFGIEALNRHFIKDWSLYYRTFKAFEPEKSRAEVLFLGDSHFVSGIEPSLFGIPSANLSFAGANYMASYYILKKLIDEMPNLKTVVLPVDLHSFSSFRTDEIQKYLFWDQFIDYDELHRISKKRQRQFLRMTVLSKDFGRKSFAGNLREFVLGRPKNLPDPTENIVETVASAEMKDKALLKARQQFDGQEIFDPVLLIYFEKILNLLKERNIRVITVQMPVSEVYLESIKPYVSKEELKTKVLDNPKYKNSITANFDFLNYYSGQSEFFSWAGWRDGDHLDAQGRIRFSKAFAQKIKRWM